MEFPISDVLQLFSIGLVAGSGLGAVTWLIGYAVSSIFKLISK